MKHFESLVSFQKLEKIMRRLEQLQEIRYKIENLEDRYMATWKEVKEAVDAEDLMTDELVAMLDKVRADLEAAMQRETLDPAELQAVVDQLKADTEGMKAKMAMPTEEKPVEDVPVEQVPS